MPRYTLSKLTCIVTALQMVYLRKFVSFAKKNKRVRFCGSLDHQGASTDLIITLMDEGCHPLFVRCWWNVSRRAPGVGARGLVARAGGCTSRDFSVSERYYGTSWERAIGQRRECRSSALSLSRAEKNATRVSLLLSKVGEEYKENLK